MELYLIKNIVKNFNVHLKMGLMVFFIENVLTSSIFDKNKNIRKMCAEHLAIGLSDKIETYILLISLLNLNQNK